MYNTKKISTNFIQAPIWQILDQGAGRFVRIAASIVLARILFPEDFGIYALSFSLLELARLSVNLGIGSAIIQTSDSPDSFSNSAFWVNLAASVFMYLNSIIFALLGARILNAPILIYTVPVLGITLITGGFTHVNHSLLFRNLEFKTIAKASVTKLAVESAGSIAFALQGFGVWSFILGYVLGDIAQSILILIWTDWRPNLKPNFHYPKKYWKFGGNIFLFCLSSYLLEYMPNIIVGHISSAYILGLFSFAWRQSRWIGDIPKLIGKNLLFPAFSRFQLDSVKFASLYEKWLRFMLAWGSPIFILQFVLAPIYVPVIFGGKWIPAITALQVLVVMAFIEVTFYVPHSEALTARGRVEKNVYWRILESLVLGITLFYVTSYGPAAIAIGILTVRIGILPLYLVMTYTSVEINLKNLFKSVWPTLALGCCGWVLMPFLFNHRSHISFLMLISFLTIFTITWILLSLRYVPETKKLFFEIVNIVSGFFKSLRQTVVVPLE